MPSNRRSNFSRVSLPCKLCGGKRQVPNYRERLKPCPSFLVMFSPPPVFHYSQAHGISTNCHRDIFYGHRVACKIFLWIRWSARSGPRAFHATLKRIVAVAHSIILCRRPVARSIGRARSNALLLVAYCRHLPLIYRQSLAKAAGLFYSALLPRGMPVSRFTVCLYGPGNTKQALCQLHLRCERN